MTPRAPRARPSEGMAPLIDVRLLARILWLRRRLRGRQRWTSEQLRSYQRESLVQLRSHAYRLSPFYRSFHRGLFDRPLEALPVLTKSMLMENFDRLVTDPAVKLQDVNDFLPGLENNQRFLNKYWVCTTSGTTGRRGVFLFDFWEWTSVIASYARSEEWGGAQAGLTSGGAEHHEEGLIQFHHIVVGQQHGDGLAGDVRAENQHAAVGEVIQAVGGRPIHGRELHGRDAVRRAGAQHQQRHAAGVLQ